VGILFSDGSDKESIDRIKSAVESTGGTAFLVAPKIGKIKVKGGTLQAEGQLAGSPSVIFDAIASILMPDAVEKLLNDSAAVQWFADAYAHCKTIAYCQGTKKLLAKANVDYDAGVVAIADFPRCGISRH